MPLAIFVVLLASGWFAERTLAQGPGTSVSSSEDIPEWLKGGGVIVGLVAGPGIAVWYLWHQETKVKPRDQQMHQEQMKILVERYTAQALATEERHAAHWSLANTNARADLHELEKTRREDNQRLVAAIEKLIDRVADGECKFERASNAPRP